MTTNIGSKGPAVSEFGVNADGIGNARSDDRSVVNLGALHAPTTGAAQATEPAVPSGPVGRPPDRETSSATSVISGR